MWRPRPQGDCTQSLTWRAQPRSLLLFVSLSLTPQNVSPLCHGRSKRHDARSHPCPCPFCLPLQFGNAKNGSFEPCSTTTLIESIEWEVWASHEDDCCVSKWANCVRRLPFRAPNLFVALGEQSSSSCRIHSLGADLKEYLLPSPFRHGQAL